MEHFIRKYHKMWVVIFLTVLNVSMTIPIKKVSAQPELIELPEFMQCTCDSGTFCLTDDDVMRLHAWHENVKYLENRRLFIVEQADAVPGD